MWSSGQNLKAKSCDILSWNTVTDLGLKMQTPLLKAEKTYEILKLFSKKNSKISNIKTKIIEANYGIMMHTHTLVIPIQKKMHVVYEAKSDLDHTITSLLTMLKVHSLVDSNLYSKARVSSSRSIASYVQRWALCSNCLANL